MPPFDSIGSPDCCCHGGPPPTQCPLTIHLQDGCTGAAISGATIDIKNSSGTVIATGSTDGGGNYTFPNPTPTGASSWTLAYDGATASAFYTAISSGNCNNPTTLCYYHARITVQTPDDPDATVTPPAGFTVDAGSSTPGSTAMIYKKFGPCSPSPFPVTACFTVGSAGFIPNCGEATVHCGDDVTITINEYNYTADYAVYHQDCDLGCAGVVDPGCDNTTYGEGPLHRGVQPKEYFLTLNGGCKFSIPGTITLTWNGSFWDSGCIGASGNCCAGPYAGNTISSARVVLSLTGPPTLSMAVYSDGGCVHQIGCPIGIHTFTESACELTSPVDLSGTMVAVDGVVVSFILTD